MAFMAANLHAAGFPLVVRDADPARQTRFAAEHPGARAADSPAPFAAVGIVVTMLPNGAIVREALLGWGIAAALGRGAGPVRPGRRPVRRASGLVG
jgi:3-hydroxyisobutyrate dehydrogenase